MNEFVCTQSRATVDDSGHACILDGSAKLTVESLGANTGEPEQARLLRVDEMSECVSNRTSIKTSTQEGALSTKEKSDCTTSSTRRGAPK